MIFNINLFSIKKSYFWFPRLSSITMATSSSGCSRDFLKLSFHISLYGMPNTSEVTSIFVDNQKFVVDNQKFVLTIRNLC